MSKPYQTGFVMLDDIDMNGKSITGVASKTGNSLVASYYISSPAASDIITPGTQITIKGTATGGLTGSDFTIGTADGGSITYNGTSDITVKLQAIISMTSNVGSQTAKFGFAINGSYIAGSEQHREIGTGSHVGNCSIQWPVVLETSDVVKIFCDIGGGTNPTITAEKAHCMVWAA